MLPDKKSWETTASFLKVQIQGQVPQKGGENMLKGLLILAGMVKLYRLVRKYR